jgi:hypothetical protein
MAISITIKNEVFDLKCGCNQPYKIEIEIFKSLRKALMHHKNLTSIFKPGDNAPLPAIGLTSLQCDILSGYLHSIQITGPSKVAVERILGLIDKKGKK